MENAVQIHSIEVSVYADEFCKHEIEKYHLSEQFADASFDFHDGLDWWTPILSHLDQAFGVHWQHAFVKSADGSQARMFSRSLKDSGGSDFVPKVEPMLIGMTRGTLASVAVHASSDRHAAFDLTQFDFNGSYMDGSHEAIIQKISALLQHTKRRFAHAFILSNPTPTERETLMGMDHFTWFELKSSQQFSALSLMDSRLTRIARMTDDLIDMAEQLDALGFEGRQQVQALLEMLHSEKQRHLQQFDQEFTPRVS